MAGIQPVHPSVEIELRIERAMEAVLIGLVAFVPWPFGSVYAWGEEVIICASAFLALLFTAKLLAARHTRVAWSWTYLPILLFVLLALLQLIPLPHPVLGFVSPNTLKLKARLLADLPGAGAAMPLTFNANATGHDLRMVLACSVIFVVSLNVLRTRGRIKRVLIAISAVGGLFCILALAQDMTDATKIYWVYTKPIVIALSGPFVGHNDLPLFANLSIGAAAALLMYMVVERRSAGSHHGSRGLPQSVSRYRVAAIVALVAVIVLGCGAVFLSLSRSGLAALGASTICIGVVAAIRWRLSAERLLIGICILACFAVSFYLASASVSHRLASLEHPLEEYVVRWQITKDILAAWPKYPLWGTGLGTHEWVYPMFDRILETTNFDHAENEYAQMLEETGAIGLAIILLFVGLMVAAFFRAVKRSTHSPIGAAAFGLGLGPLAVIVQSGFGFGAHLPANAVLMAIVCALLVNVARIPQHRGAPSATAPASSGAGGPHAAPLGFLVSLLIAAATCALFVPAVLSADRARRGDDAWETARPYVENLYPPPISADDPKLQETIDAAGTAHLAEPDNCRYFYWEVYYRWRLYLVTHQHDIDVGPMSEAESADVRQFAAQFDSVRKLCPSFAFPLFMAGQLRYLILDDDKGLDLIKTAGSIDSSSPDIAGKLAAIDCYLGNFDGAVQHYRHYLSLEGLLRGSFDTVVNVLVTQYKRPDLAIELAAHNPLRELKIVPALRAIPDRPDFQTLAVSLEKSAQAARRAELVEACSSPDVSAGDLAALADIYASEHNSNDAIACYRRALVKDYGNVEWRVALARALLGNGQKQEAMDEAEICLRLRPDAPEARQLISDANSPKTGPGKQ